MQTKAKKASKVFAIICLENKFRMVFFIPAFCPIRKYDLYEKPKGSPNYLFTLTPHCTINKAVSGSRTEAASMTEPDASLAGAGGGGNIY